MKLLLLIALYIPLTAPAANPKWILPQAPKAIGNYLVAQQSGNLVFINQIALKDGKVLNPGKLGLSLSITQGKEAAQQTMLNVLSILKDHLKGDLSRVNKVVQITGYFNTSEDFTDHALILNEASSILVDFFGENGKHARASVGVSSLPMKSSVEIQAIFEVKNK